MKKIPITNELLGKIVAAMKQSDLFSSLDENSLGSIAKRTEVIQYDLGDNIIVEKEKTDSFYLVISGGGTIHVSRPFSPDPIEIGSVKPYVALGEVSLLLNEDRTATVRASETTFALKFDQTLFNYMFKNVPAFGVAICRNLAKTIKRLSARASLPDFDEKGYVPDTEINTILPLDFVIRHRVLPLVAEGNVLSIGFVNEPTTGAISACKQFVPGMELSLYHIGSRLFDDVVASLSGIDETRISAPKQTKKKPAKASPMPAKLQKLLRRMVQEGASDLHLSAGYAPLWRIDGDIREIKGVNPLDEDEVLGLLEPIMEDRIKNIFLETSDADFVCSIPGLARFRVNIFRDNRGVSSVLRFIPETMLSFEQLGLPLVIKKLCDYPKGLVVVTGPTGSGKSTTLAAMIDYINRTYRKHVLTMEDPIEFVHENKLCLINQREIGGHTRSFASALKSALREDPDIVLVGELRDLETVELALETANTGHLVFATLHTATAISTISRIVDLFPPEQHNQVRTSVAECLRGIVAQTLCRKIGGGRIAALEVLVANNAVANLIREEKDNQIMSTMQAGKALGNMILNEELYNLVLAGKVAKEEAMSKAINKEDLARRLG